jgi:hypothetical protein
MTQLLGLPQPERRFVNVEDHRRELVVAAGLSQFFGQVEHAQWGLFGE